MLNTTTIDEASALITSEFVPASVRSESVPLSQALGRVLAQDVTASAAVPEFNRSTVDGYAVKASDIFGCSEAIPAVLKLAGESVMGVHTAFSLKKGECAYVPTGGELPDGADLVVMLEDTEDFGDGTVGVNKPGAPGLNLIFKGDDVRPGDRVYSKGQQLDVKDIGALAALGYAEVPVMCPPRVSILSTGDEIIDVGGMLEMGKIRDVNGPMLCSAVKAFGAAPVFGGIISDDRQAIQTAIHTALEACDLLIISGGTSVGTRDAIPEAVAHLGEIMVQGLAVKPGKPTIVGRVYGKPVFGLPGNPVAAFFMASLLVRPLIFSMLGASASDHDRQMPLSHAMPSNHGREDLVPVSVVDGFASPIITKSGLITTLSEADGFIRIPRDCEGVSKGELVKVIYF